MTVVEHVRVVSVTPARQHVEIASPGESSSCGSCTRATNCSSVHGLRAMDVCGLEDAAPGDDLTVAIELASPVWAAFVLFVLPMLVAFAAGIAVERLAASGALGLLAGALGAAAAWGGVYLFGPSGPPRARRVPAVSQDGEAGRRGCDDRREETTC
jgi:positive regulator of sigma E activity